MNRITSLLIAAVIAYLTAFPLTSAAQDSGACGYAPEHLTSWKELMSRQLKIYDKENAKNYSKISSDIIDGNILAFTSDMVGVNPNTVLKLAGGETTLLDLAVAACQQGIVVELVTLGAAVDGSEYSTPLVTASAKGQQSTIEFLIKHGARIEKTDINGKTALEASIRQKQRGAVSMLLKYGSSPNQRLPNGASLLDLVSHSADPTDKSVAAELTRYGATSHLNSTNEK